MVIAVSTGTVGTQNILPSLRVSEMSWPIISKKRKPKKSKKKRKKYGINEQ